MFKDIRCFKFFSSKNLGMIWVFIEKELLDKGCDCCIGMLNNFKSNKIKVYEFV